MVVVIPITEDNGIILADQFRVGVNSNVIGLPAGHVGDDPGHENENIIEAAKRELLEETGYGDGEFTYLGKAASSPGMTDEITHFVLAKKVKKIQEADSGDENIVIHEVPLPFLGPWIVHQQKHTISAQMLAALWAYDNYNIVRGRIER